MDQRRADQPGHERCVLHRIPEPPAAPTQRVVRPAAAQRDADGEEAPRDGRPGPRPARPRRIEATAQQGRQREGKRHRKADIAHVEQRRMEHHPRILQEGIQVAAFGRRRHQPIEGVRRQQQEEQEADADQTHDREHARHHLLRQVAREQCHREAPAAQHQRPQEQRSLVRAPRRRDAILQRQFRIRICGDVLHREVVADERPREAAEGECDQQCLRARGGPSDRH